MNLLLKKVWRIVFFTDMTNNHCYTWRHKFQHFIVINSDVTACDIIFYPPYRKSFSKFIALSIRSEICSDSLSDPCKIAFLWDSKDSVKVQINYFNMKLNLSKITFPKHKQSVSLIQSVITLQLRFDQSVVLFNNNNILLALYHIMFISCILVTIYRHNLLI